MGFPVFGERATDRCPPPGTFSCGPMQPSSVSLRLLFLFAFGVLFLPPAEAQPVSHAVGLTAQPVTGTVDAVRIRFDPVSARLVLSGLGGTIMSVDPAGPIQLPAVRYRQADHGTPSPLMGMDIAADGTIYLVGNDAASHAGYTVGVVRRGRPDGQGGHVWETVATTEPYPRSATPFDHNMNAIVLSPDGTSLYINSGSRTDHGELQENGGQFPGEREVPLTSAILRIPADATDLVLPNDLDALTQGGYLFADGTRNSFSLAFDGRGRLFGTENSGDRDDEEELNLLEEGRHYGFPWRMGLTDTPMQFPGYDPAADRLLNPRSYAVQNGHFHTDPAYPPPPAGLTFTDPLRNLGPWANLYRDPATGAILDADDTGVPLATFTSHRSPLGLVFDTAGQLPEPFTGSGLMLSWTGPESDLLAPYVGEGEDLVRLTLAESDGHPAVHVERLMSGFRNPIDAVLVGSYLYVLEFGSDARVWRIGFGQSMANEPEEGLPAHPGVELWPNPASGDATLRLSAHTPGRVRATLHAPDGREISSVLDRPMHAGEDIELRMPTRDLPRGIYFLVVESAGNRRSRAIVLQ
jgi:hypothetical protein